MATQKKGGGNKKYGSNKKWCEIYRSQGTRMKNKVRKMVSHLRRFPSDNQTVNRLRSIKESARGPR